MAEVVITNDNFEVEVLKADTPVLVDFWATWCGPCQMLGPIVAQIAAENEGSLKVGKVNVDDEPELAAKFGITSIPTMIVFKDGQAVNQSVGFVEKEKIEALFK